MTARVACEADVEWDEKRLELEVKATRALNGLKHRMQDITTRLVWVIDYKGFRLQACLLNHESACVMRTGCAGGPVCLHVRALGPRTWCTTWRAKRHPCATLSPWKSLPPWAACSTCKRT